MIDPIVGKAGEAVLRAVINAALKRVFGSRPSPEGASGARVDLSAVPAALAAHLRVVANWSSQVSHRDLAKSRDLAEVFIEQRMGRRPADAIVRGPEELLQSTLNLVILGHPGAGKTTTIKRICQHLLAEEGTERDAFGFPLLVRLPEIPAGIGVIQFIAERLRMQIAIPAPPTFRTHEQQVEHARAVASLTEAVVVEFLESQRVVLCLDGLDEVALDAQGPVHADIRALGNLLSASMFVLTCRLGSFSFSIDNTETLEIQPFDDSEIRSFVEHWFKSADIGEQFLREVERTPYRDTIGRPLTLTNLCMLYDSSGELPDQPFLIYQRVVNLLLEDWDRQRDLRRASRYGQFGPERKRQFLAAMSWELTIEHSGPSYSQAQFARAYSKVHRRFGLPLESKDRVIAEIESHTGLLMKVGYDYEFTHKSLQEYLCADHISRTPDISRSAGQILEMPNEAAIATVLSADPNEFFHLLAGTFASLSFWRPYLTRLVVEGAAFTTKVVLGVDLVRVAALAWSLQGPDHPRREDGADAFEKAFEEFLGKARLEHEFKLGRRLFDVVETNRAWVRLRIKSKSMSQLPEGYPHTLIISPSYAVD